MGTHESRGKSCEWYTPKYIFDALECGFTLDVASPIDRTFCHVPAYEFITENSLDLEWNGFVWMNPPFGHQKDKFRWMNKFIAHGNGIALTPDRTSAPWWQHSIKHCDAVLFVDGKIKFTWQDGSLGEQPGNGTSLFAIGKEGVKALENGQKNKLGILLKHF